MESGVGEVIGVADFLFYGIDENGRAEFSKVLRGQERWALEPLARQGLRRWHGVEIWHGPMCVVRLRRTVSGAPRDNADRSVG